MSKQRFPVPTAQELMDFESGAMDDDDTVDLFQRLVDSGLAWQLQGSYGRMAKNLIADGLVRDTHNVLGRRPAPSTDWSLTNGTSRDMG